MKTKEEIQAKIEEYKNSECYSSFDEVGKDSVIAALKWVLGEDNEE